MTATITDLFCGAGGSSLGAEWAGGEIVMAANHWQVAIDVHQVAFPNARHDCADISQADPRRYPVTDILIASPECTNHSQARGVSRKRQDPSLFDAPDPAAERSRATMWDVIRFTEQMRYAAVVVENVVEATKWVLWPAWVQGMTDLGYTMTLLSHNSMHHGVPQSRDRIYAVWLRNGITAELEYETQAWCPRCDTISTARQGWKNGRRVGRYRSQWVWACTGCGKPVEPPTRPAADIIDWGLTCPPFGIKKRAHKTRMRVWAGMCRHGWVPISTPGAGNTWERTPGNRARPLLTDPLPTQTTTLESAVATPPGFLFNTAHGGRVSELENPHPTVCASDDRQALVVPLRNHGRAEPADDSPLPTVTAGGNHHGLVVTNNPHNVARSTDEPLATATTSPNRHGLVVDYRRGSHARSTDDPMATQATHAQHGLLVRNNGVTGGHPSRHTTSTDEPARTMVTTNRPSLLMRNNEDSGRGEMCTPVSEPARTMTTKGHQSLLTADDLVLTEDEEALLDSVGFRMLEPYEVAGAMAFPVGYIPRDLPKDKQVMLAGNAVTPPVMQWIIGRVLQAIGA